MRIGCRVTSFRSRHYPACWNLVLFRPRRSNQARTNDPDMNSDLLTILVGALGVVAAVLCTYVAYKAGVRRADEQKAELVRETGRQKAELASEFHHDVSRVFETVVDAVQSADLIRSREPSPARRADVVVRASLGTLLDERGEVRLQRLFDVVASTLGTPSREQTVSALQRLREHGLVAWEGSDDLCEADVVRVCLPGVTGAHPMRQALTT